MFGNFLNKKQTEEPVAKNTELRNKVTFDGTILSQCRETQRTEGLYLFKIRGQVNGTACEIPAFVKSALLAEQINEIEKFALVSVSGHLEYPIWTVRGGSSTKSKLLFVADWCEKIWQKNIIYMEDNFTIK